MLFSQLSEENKPKRAIFHHAEGQLLEALRRTEEWYFTEEGLWEPSASSSLETLQGGSVETELHSRKA